MAREKISGIYCIRRLGTLDFYVGSSVDINKRWNQHKQALTRGDHSSPHLQNAWNCYSELLFEFEILEIVPSHLIVNRRSLMPFEQKWIDLVKPCYNTCKVAGSSLGYKHTPEAKAKMSDAQKGKTHTLEHRLKLSKTRIGNKNTLGHKHTIEAKLKISVARTGTKCTPETKLKMSIAAKIRELNKTRI